MLGEQLRAELQRNLDKVTPLPDLDYEPPVQDAKAIIAPWVTALCADLVIRLGSVNCPQTRRVLLLRPGGSVGVRCYPDGPHVSRARLCWSSRCTAVRKGVGSDSPLTASESSSWGPRITHFYPESRCPSSSRTVHRSGIFRSTWTPLQNCEPVALSLTCPPLSTRTSTRSRCICLTSATSSQGALRNELCTPIMGGGS